ncbi:sensor histidine kinase [Sphingomonas sp. UYP23]
MIPVFLVGMSLVYLTARTYGELTADRSFDRVLEGSAISIFETLSVSDSGIRVDLPYAALEMLSAAPDDQVFYSVVGPDGRTLTGYDDLPGAAADGSTAPRDKQDVPRFLDAEYRGKRVRIVIVGREVVYHGHKGWVRVEVAQTRLARDGVARESVLHALLPIVMFSVLALALVWFGISSALQPLRAVGAELTQRDPADLHAIDAAVPAEIVPLTLAINGFMGRLDVNLLAMKAFIADASHQLRTPLAAMLAQAYATPRDDPAALRRSLAAIERSGTKLTHLLNQLLSDATIAHRADLRHFSSLDLLRLISDMLADTVRSFEESDVRFTTPLKTALLVGDRLMLGEALKNLVINAIRHGGGEVELALTNEPNTYRVTIADRGPGIAASQRERVFERFVRADRSEGAGIGLAIARQAIESHGGHIALDDRDGGGLLVTIHLPRDIV